MSFIIKFISAVLIIVTIYIVTIFLAPKQADDFARYIGIMNINNYLRNFKTWADWVSDDLLQLKSAKEQIDNARNTVNKVSDTINKTQEEIAKKVDQANKVYESGKKVIDSTKELQKNLWELTTISWSWDTEISSWSIDTFNSWTSK